MSLLIAHVVFHNVNKVSLYLLQSKLPALVFLCQYNVFLSVKNCFCQLKLEDNPGNFFIGKKKKASAGKHVLEADMFFFVWLVFVP